MIAEFLQIDLISELGLDKLPEEARKSLEVQMMETLENRLASEIFPLLSEEDVDKLEALDDAKVEGFLREKIPSIALIVAEVVAGFKKEMLELNAAVDNARQKTAQA